MPKQPRFASLAFDLIATIIVNTLATGHWPLPPILHRRCLHVVLSPQWRLPYRSVHSRSMRSQPTLSARGGPRRTNVRLQRKVTVRTAVQAEWGFASGRGACFTPPARGAGARARPASAARSDFAFGVLTPPASYARLLVCGHRRGAPPALADILSEGHARRLADHRRDVCPPTHTFLGPDGEMAS